MEVLSDHNPLTSIVCKNHGIVVKGTRIVIPLTYRPDITDDNKPIVDKCAKYLENCNRNQKEPYDIPIVIYHLIYQ